MGRRERGGVRNKFRIDRGADGFGDRDKFRMGAALRHRVARHDHRASAVASISAATASAAASPRSRGATRVGAIRSRSASP